MAIKNSGNPLSFSEIEAEFGPNPTRSLGKYRTTSPTFSNGNKGPGDGLNGSSLASNIPLDSGIPTSGAIKFSQFYGKRLNIVIDYYSGSNMNRTGTGGGGDNKQAASWRFANESGFVKVVGGYKTAPLSSVDGNYILSSSEWQGGKKVIINVNKRLGSERGSRGRVALRTGRWPSGTELQLDIGSSGELRGAGGDGGSGTGSGKSNAADGEEGTSALGIEYATHINDSGVIRCGYGGGGGGTGGNSNPNKNPQDYGRGGGGGAGGAGFPAGDGGAGGPNGFGGGPQPDGEAGGSGSLNGSGNPGDGGNSYRGAFGGAGGDGGGFGPGQDPAAAEGGKGGTGQGRGYDPSQPGGEPGVNGFGIIFRNSTVESQSDGAKNTPGSEGGDSSSQAIQ